MSLIETGALETLHSLVFQKVCVFMCYISCPIWTKYCTTDLHLLCKIDVCLIKFGVLKFILYLWSLNIFVFMPSIFRPISTKSVIWLSFFIVERKWVSLKSVQWKLLHNISGTISFLVLILTFSGSISTKLGRRDLH